MSDSLPPGIDYDTDRPAGHEPETTQRATDHRSGTTRSATNRPDDVAGIAPLAELIAKLTRENRELAAAAAQWRERVRFLGERLQAIEAGPVAGDMADPLGVHERGPRSDAVAAEAATTTAAWRRWWRRMTGGAVDLS